MSFAWALLELLLGIEIVLKQLLAMQPLDKETELALCEKTKGLVLLVGFQG